MNRVRGVFRRCHKEKGQATVEWTTTLALVLGLALSALLLLGAAGSGLFDAMAKEVGKTPGTEEVPGPVEPPPTNTYTVTFKDWDGSVISSSQYRAGAALIVPADPSRAADAENTYIFTGWQPALEYSVNGSATYAATYAASVRSYTVTFVAPEINFSSSQIITYGATPTTPDTIKWSYTNSGKKYTFAGWNPGVDVCTGDRTYTALWDAPVEKHTITFTHNGLVFASRIQNTGELILSPVTNPTKASDVEHDYTFAGWNGYTPGMTVSKDISFEATWTTSARSYDIMFMSEGTMFQKVTVAYGSPIITPATNPTKASDVEHDYTFAGWNGYTPGMTCTGAASFTARYDQVVRTYDITFMNGNEVFSQSRLAYGALIPVPVGTPTKASAVLNAEGSQYEFFKAPGTKRMVWLNRTEAGRAFNWAATRSPTPSLQSYFVSVAPDGTKASTHTSNNLGIPIAFSLGNDAGGYTHSSLSEYTWDELKTVSGDIASKGSASSYMSEFTAYMNADQRKKTALPGGSVLECRIVGINHDSKSDGSGTAGLTFMATHSLPEKRMMNKSGTNVGGWLMSNMRNSTLGSDDYAWNLLPADLQGAICAVDKFTNNKGQTSVTSDVSKTADKLWLPSATELWGDMTPTGCGSAVAVLNAEGSQYEFFKGKRVTKSNFALLDSLCRDRYGNSQTCAWTRSAYGGSSNTFVCVMSGGDWNAMSASDAYGMPIGFAI